MASPPGTRSAVARGAAALAPVASAMAAAACYHAAFAGGTSIPPGLAAGVAGALGLAMAAGVVRLQCRGVRHAWLAPWLWVIVPLAVKCPVTRLSPGPHWWVMPLAAVGLGVTVPLLPVWPRALSPRSLLVSLVLAPAAALVLGIAGPAALAEQPIVTGEIETILRDLARQVSDDVAANGPPPADPRTWQTERLRAAGWSVRLAPTPQLVNAQVALAYSAPAPSGSLWATVLAGQSATSFYDPRARRFTVRISLDGAIAWSWPDGPPAAVRAKRAMIR